MLSIEQQVNQGTNVYGIIFLADEGEAWTTEQMVAALRGVADLVNTAINNDPLLDRQAANGSYGFASDQSSPRMWQQSVGGAGTAHTEIWADMYLGWTSNSWETQADGSFTPRGEARSNFMSSITPLLVDVAISH